MSANEAPMFASGQEDRATKGVLVQQMPVWIIVRSAEGGDLIRQRHFKGREFKSLFPPKTTKAQRGSPALGIRSYISLA